MSQVVGTVLGHVVNRSSGTVLLHVTTEHGGVTLRFTPADAQIVGSALRLKAVAPAGEKLDGRPHFRAPEINHLAAVGLGLPLQKPGGGI